MQMQKNSVQQALNHLDINKPEKIITLENKTQDVDPLRVILIGLPSSGKDIVADILIIELKPQEEQTSKLLTNLCFNQFKGRKLYVMQQPNHQIIKNLKKRNFVNVILVQGSSLKRYQNYLLKGEKQNEQQSQLQAFLQKDDLMQNQQYQKCLQYVRVRIFNRSDIVFLQRQIQSKKDIIVKPFRPTWQEYFMKIADIARRRSNCMKSSVGAVIVNDQNRVVSTGYNGTPTGLDSCFKNGCQRCNSNSNKSLDQCLCLHAEESAIIQVGINRTKGCHLYTTLYPCFSCAKIIKQAGIQKIFYLQDYDKEDSGKNFLQSNFNRSNIVRIKIDNIYY